MIPNSPEFGGIILIFAQNRHTMTENTRTIAPVVPTFYFFQGIPHRVTAWILEDCNFLNPNASGYRFCLSFINEKGWLEKGDDNKANGTFTNPLPRYIFEDAIEEFLGEYSPDEIKRQLWYKQAISLGIDLSEIASSEDEFDRLVEEIYENWRNK